MPMPCNPFVAYIVIPACRIVMSLYMHMHRQLDQNHLHLQMANGKIPPSWGPEMERTYPFRYYEADVQLWVLATDVDPQRQGAALALRVSGCAKDVIREVDANTLVNGQVVADAQGQPLQLTGVGALLRILRRRFAPLDQEASLFALHEFFAFQRHASEDIDQLVSRFELTNHRANVVGGVVINEVGLSWLMLHLSRIPKSNWPLILAPTLGNLPQNAGEHNAFILYLRRNGHLFDRGGDPAKNAITYLAVDGHEPQNTWSQTSELPFGLGSHSYPSFPVDDDAQSFSSCNSHDSSIVDISDVHGLSFAEACEAVYMQYRTGKRRWRKFAGPRRKGKGKGKSKGHGKHGSFGSGKVSSHGKHKGSFFADDFLTHDPASNSNPDSAYPSLEDAWNQDSFAYLGSGKGNKSGPRLNPLDKSGKRMLCSLCFSDSHFIKNCPQNNGKGKGKSSFLSSETWDSAASSAVASSSAPAPAPRRIYLATEIPPIPVTPGCKITFADESDLAKPLTKTFFYPWWEVNPPSEPPEFNYHAHVRLSADRDGLLVDTGAVNSLTGDEFAFRVAKRAKSHGHGSQFSALDRNFEIEGVGKGANVCEQRALLPIALEDGSTGTFMTWSSQGSEVYQTSLLSGSALFTV